MSPSFRSLPLLGTLWSLSLPLVAAPDPAQPTFAADDPLTWAFTPARDEFSTEAVFDLRRLNEATAGEKGYVRMTPEGSFVTGDGKPVRFWAVNFEPRAAMNDEQLAYAARFLAKRGVNMVRWHGFINPKVPGSDAFHKPPMGPDEPVKEPIPPLHEIHHEQREFCWRLVAAMRREGIYLTLSPYWAVNFKHAHRFGLPANTLNDRDAQGLLFFEPRMQAAYRQWMRDLLLPPNPHTGIPLAEDPAVAVIQFQNEDSLLFWTVDMLSPEARQLLAQKYGTWLEAKYGSLEKTRTAWGEAALQAEDKWQEGVPALLKLDHFRNAPPPELATRLANQLEFYATTMRDANADLVRFLREEIGVKSLLNANNWRTANQERLNDAERWSYLPAEAIAANRYYSPPHTGQDSGWAVQPGHLFASISALRWAHAIPAAIRQIDGRATLISESTWVMPTRYRAEGPLVMAAYQSLTGVDAYYWFSFNYRDWTQPTLVNNRYQGAFKWTSQTPDVLGLFPGTALLFRRGDLREGEPAVRETRLLKDVWAAQPAAINEEPGYDPNRDLGEWSPSAGASRIPSLAYLVGPVRVSYTDKPGEARTDAADLSQWIDTTRKVVRSNTGQIELNYERGLLRVDSPRAQGITGFTPEDGTPLSTTDARFAVRNHYIHALFVSLDDAPLAESARVLLQFGTVIRPTGWQTEPATILHKGSGTELPGEKVVAIGGPPWRIERAAGTVTLKNTRVTKAFVCDTNGVPQRELTLRREAGGVALDLPSDVLYVVLR